MATDQLPAILPGTGELSPALRSTVLPVEYELALKTWFSRTTRQDAHRLLLETKQAQLILYRQGAGLILEGGTWAMVRMMPGNGRLPYIFRDGSCSDCLAGPRGSRCRHVAALAMLCLQETETGVRPSGLGFAKSPWAEIGRYLHERAAARQITTTMELQPDHILLQCQQKQGFALQIRLSHQAAAELCRLHPDLAAPNGLQVQRLDMEEISRLRKRLVLLEASESEQVLAKHGRRSRQQQVDCSLWMTLARLLYRHVLPARIHLERRDEGKFQLIIPGPEEPLFRLVPARMHTWNLLARLPADRLPLTQLPPARAWSTVSFGDDGRTIVVENRCTLEDGRTFSLKNLASCRFGRHYAVDDHFFTLQPIPREERLIRPGQDNPPLLAIASRQEDDQAGFSVAAGEIESFLEQNSRALRCGRHEVDREILELEFVSRPKRLTLTDFREEQGWCYLAGYYDLGNQRIDLVDLLIAGEKKQAYIPGRRWLQVSDSSLAWFHQLGKKRITTGADGRACLRLHRQEFLALAGQIGVLSAEFRRKKLDNTLDFLLDSTDLRQDSLPELPAHLREYQRNGTAWLYLLHRHGLGGILADDMGLGKTHQALALLSLLTGQENRFLVVCPTSVLFHWPQKQERFFPDLSLSVYYGPDRKPDRIEETNVVVTTYGLLRRDRHVLAKIPFRLVLFDEMQTLKNSKTAVYQAAAMLQTEGIIGLTGTPVENSIQELQSLFALCLPGLFDNNMFLKHVVRNDSPESRQELARIIRPFVLRRTRQQVLKELPARSEDIRICHLSDDQVAAYRQAVEQAEQVLEEKQHEDFSHVLTTITRLKQICNHLCLLEHCMDWQRYRSGKWDEWIRILEECLAADLKMVVFSQFTTMLDLMESYLRERDIAHVDLRGTTKASLRQQAIDRFNRDPDVRICCASLLAGGTGIDLTGAQVVVHFDRWWNPAREEQATARVHRMGQQHPVQVYKLVTAGTLEEKIHYLIEKKRALAEDIVGEDDGSVLKRLSGKDISALLRFRP